MFFSLFLSVNCLPYFRLSLANALKLHIHTRVGARACAARLSRNTQTNPGFRVGHLEKNAIVIAVRIIFSEDLRYSIVVRFIVMHLMRTFSNN